MFLRAIVDASIPTPNGPKYVRGGTFTDEGMSAFGETVEVPDDFVVNPNVFEVGEMVPVVAGLPGGQKAFRVLDRDASGQFVPLKGVTYQQFDEDGKPVKPPKKRGKKLPAAEAVAAE